MSTQSRPGDQDNNRSARKAYHTPELRHYGNIREITQNHGTGQPNEDTVGAMHVKSFP
jgi:hypothetical protein